MNILNMATKKNLYMTHSEIAYIAKHMRENYRKPIQINKLAEQAYISKYYFIRLFREQMGTTPYNYLLHYRIQKAKELLLSTTWNVGYIGFYVGFSSESNFTVQFTKIVKLSPLQYRKINMIVH